LYNETLKQFNSAINVACRVTSTTDHQEFALATRCGLFFCTLEPRSKTDPFFKCCSIIENKTEVYHRDKNVSGVVEIKPFILMTKIHDSVLINVINRKDMLVIKNIELQSSYKNQTLKLVHGYDSEHFPFVLARDDRSYWVIDANDYVTRKIIESEFN